MWWKYTLSGSCWNYLNDIGLRRYLIKIKTSLKISILVIASVVVEEGNGEKVGSSSGVVEGVEGANVPPGKVIYGKLVVDWKKLWFKNQVITGNSLTKQYYTKLTS